MSFEMLTEIEKRGIESILKKPPIDDLITLTKGKKTAKNSFEEVVACIISNSDTPKSFLNRPKIVRNYLCLYLQENAIVVPPAFKKDQMVNEILKLWKSDLTDSPDCLMTAKESDQQNQTIVKEKIKKSPKKTQSVPVNPASKTGEESNQQIQPTVKEKIKKVPKKTESVPVNPDISTPKKIKKLKSGEESGQPNQTIIKEKKKKLYNKPRHTATTTSSQSTALNVNVNVVQGNQSIIEGLTKTLPGPDNPVPVCQNKESSFQINQPTSDKFITNSSSATGQEFAESFVKWFYKMINSQNPSLKETPEDFSLLHFWNDISLQLSTRNSNFTETTEQFEGIEMVSRKLLGFTKEELYLFIPNVSAEGVRSKMGPHGQLGISVCGMVNRMKVFLGIFEQDFGLISYPGFQNNFKIKRTALRLRDSNIPTMPKLEEGKDLLAITR
ncbi:uncharacterized protein LOC126817822 [Patella vulgata]|uniref:uncharacterized protein LOC126817822 n=1 Tax=Patella vulgata TaxID=6465 RepID=UPI0024A86FCD|nr:uncharacterized protein LOC126817822 [Patella vulgata]